MKEELIGFVGVDSGQLMLCDPSYIDHTFAEGEYNPAAADPKSNYPMSYNGACGATLSEKGYGKLGYFSAVAFSSGLGDGVYPVYATVVETETWGRRIAGIRVDFLEEEDLD